MSETAIAPAGASALASAIRSRGVRVDDVSAPQIDGLEPSFSMAPNTTSQIQECLSEAQNTALPLVVAGTGSRVAIGNRPESLAGVLSTLGLNRLIALEPADMTVTVETGMLLSDVQRALRANGQFLPLDPAGGDGTIGGLLGSNVSGPLRHRFGTARDWLLGTRVVHADGSVSKSGGRVVKNVSGYDMHKLYVGSLGTLGVIAEATFKVASLPRVDRTIAIACPSAVAATSIIAACHERGLAVFATELLSPTATEAMIGATSWCALIRVAGGFAATARTLRELDEYVTLAGEVRDADDDVWARWRDCFALGALSLRVSVAASRLADTAEALDRRLVGNAARITATVTSGVVRVDLKPRDDERALAIHAEAEAIAASRGGSLFVDAAPVALKSAVDVFGAPRGDIEIMRRLKHEFDPHRILAPGRFAGRI
jgi:glycolate oxidase FAD binding subunit